MKIVFEGSNLDAVLQRMSEFCDQVSRVDKKAVTSQPDDATETPVAANDNEKAPKSSRRRTLEGKQDANPTFPTFAKGAASSRRKSGSKKTTATIASRSEKDEIKDSDLTKAASKAAKDILPKGVKAIIEDFGVKDLAKLDQDKRANFLAALKKAVKKVAE